MSQLTKLQSFATSVLHNVAYFRRMILPAIGLGFEFAARSSTLGLVSLTAVVLFSGAAYADDVTISVSPTNISLTEGSTLTATLTITNTSATDTIQVQGLEVSNIFSTTGDSTDSGAGSLIGTACLTSVLAPGSNCSAPDISFGTDPLSGTETDEDSGITPVNLNLLYCVYAVGAGCTSYANVQEFVNVTVTDPVPSTNTPEPSSMALLGAGLASAGLLKRKFK